MSPLNTTALSRACPPRSDYHNQRFNSGHKDKAIMTDAFNLSVIVPTVSLTLIHSAPEATARRGSARYLQQGLCQCRQAEPRGLPCAVCRRVTIHIQSCWRGYLGRLRFAAARAAHDQHLRQVRVCATLFAACIAMQSSMMMLVLGAHTEMPRTCCPLV